VDLAFIEQALERLPDNTWIRAGALLAAFVVLAWLVEWVATHLVARWAKRSSTDIDDRLIAVLHRPIFISVLLLGAWLVLLRIDLQPASQLLLQRLIKTVAILLWTIFGWKISRILLEAFSRLEERMKFVQPRTVPLLDNTLRIVLVGGVIYFLFLTWGINVAAWMAGAGILGIAVGFAAKDTLANLFAGIFILVDAPYENGDFIVLDSGERGMVTKIGLRSTRILTRDDIEITVPNAVIANAKITNETGGPWQKRRIRITLGVGYGSDLDHVRETLLEIARTHPQVSNEPDPRVRFREFGDSALKIQLLCWIDEPVLRGRVTDALSTEIHKRFQAEGIDIPFPTRDLRIQHLPSAETDSAES